MSELNIYHHELRPNEYAEFYLKYEADRCIALLKDKANYNEYAYKLKSEESADTCRFYEKEVRHQKFKRCLAMAKWCESEAYIHEHGSEYDENLVAWFGKWYKRWLELAEKFKEVK